MNVSHNCIQTKSEIGRYNFAAYRISSTKTSNKYVFVNKIQNAEQNNHSILYSHEVFAILCYLSTA